MPFAKLDSRSLLQLTGKDVRDFLQNLVTNDLGPLSSAKTIYAALLTPQGKFLHDFLILEDENALYLDCLTERKSDLIRRLTLYKLRADVLIEDVTDHWDLYAEFGTDMKETSSLSLGQVEMHETYRRYRDPRQESLGHRIIGKKGTNWLDDFGSPQMADEAAYHDFRLSLGIPEGGRDIQPEKNFLLEMNFEELHGVSFSKGCYVGQELTARTKHRAKIKKRLFHFTFEGDIEVGSSIQLDNKEIATVTAFSAPNGLALTRLEGWEKIKAGGTSLQPEGLTLNKPDYVNLPATET